MTKTSTRSPSTSEPELGDERFAVIGWSYGGCLAAGVTRRLPEQVSGLMMVCRWRGLSASSGMTGDSHLRVAD